MNIRDAILKAADHIERNPDLWNFGNCSVGDCGTPACALGWIGHFAGLKSGDNLIHVTDLMGIPHIEVYDKFQEFAPRGSFWRDSMGMVASCLRGYADKYHPAPKEEKKEILRTKRTGIPADIRDIFSEDFHRDRTEVVRSLVRS